jgi:hypothetical protein
LCILADDGDSGNVEAVVHDEEEANMNESDRTGMANCAWL